MRKSFARIKGAGFILWHTRHEFYHIVTGLIFAWFLRELWRQFNTTWILLSIFGSLIPDLDHFIYFFTYGKNGWYPRQIRLFFRNHEWRSLWIFVETGHKYNTELITHNYYFMALLFIILILSFFVDSKVGVIIFGTMLLHYLLDVFDDIVALGHMNANWKRWGKPKKIKTLSY